MSTEKPEVLPDVHDPNRDPNVEFELAPSVVAPVDEEQPDSEESLASEAIHRPRPEISPPIKAVNMPM